MDENNLEKIKALLLSEDSANVELGVTLMGGLLDDEKISDFARCITRFGMLDYLEYYITVELTNEEAKKENIKEILKRKKLEYKKHEEPDPELIHSLVCKSSHANLITDDVDDLCGMPFLKKLEWVRLSLIGATKEDLQKIPRKDLLISLTLVDWDFDEFPTEFADCTKLKSLALISHEKKHRSLPKGLERFPTLNHLTIFCPRLVKLPSKFEKLNLSSLMLDTKRAQSLSNRHMRRISCLILGQVPKEYGYQLSLGNVWGIVGVHHEIIDHHSLRYYYQNEKWDISSYQPSKHHHRMGRGIMPGEKYIDRFISSEKYQHRKQNWYYYLCRLIIDWAGKLRVHRIIPRRLMRLGSWLRGGLFWLQILLVAPFALLYWIGAKLFKKKS